MLRSYWKLMENGKNLDFFFKISLTLQHVTESINSYCYEFCVQSIMSDVINSYLCNERVIYPRIENDAFKSK